MYFSTIKYLIPNTFRPEIKLKSSPLAILAVLVIISIVLINFYTALKKVESYDSMISAAKKINLAYNEIRQYRQKNNIRIDPVLDPHASGFIGVEFSPLTTTLGNLEAKQFALYPDFSALMVKWINELGFPPNSDIIIHASASFPALTIMAIIACESMNMNPLIITSLGASSYGANIPEFNYLDIENYLYQKNVIHHRSNLVTPGGENDNGSSFWAGGMDVVIQSAKRNKYNLAIPHSLQDAIDMKWQLCNEEIDPVLFINIGGNHSAMGSSECALAIPVGRIFKKLNCLDIDQSGLIHKFSNAGVPVFHFLQIRELAVKNGMTFTSISPGEIGKSAVYFRKSKPTGLIFILLTTIVTVLIVLSKKYNIYNKPSVSSTISTSRK